ncbi:tail assembly chaperone [Vibrio phage Ceto]|uniref:Tape measure chaperone n=1 Tax=Vibrio phage Ceto TaxID=2570300 RepID=A0A2H5BGD2_9CAUD|nr:tail assembly chaperone [Vibrio phage Ceto]AUG85040.1 hypothetical protein CETO_33 [Vibrio phage Ceto]
MLSWHKSRTFETERRKLLFESLDKYFDKQNGFSKSKYINICMQLGEKPDPKRMPIDFSDFPPIVRDAIEIFNRLGDRYTSTDLGPLYIGKDISTLDFLYNIYEIHDVEDRKLTLEIVQHLDSKIVKQAVSKWKTEAKKLKAKAKHH